MATLRKKVLSGKITGKEYVEMVYRHLEMRALGFLEEEPSSEEMAAPAAAASGPSRESRVLPLLHRCSLMRIMPRTDDYASRV